MTEESDETISGLIRENARLGGELKRTKELLEIVSGKRDAQMREEGINAILDSMYAYYTSFPYPGECHYKMNSDRCLSYKGNCEICVFDHAVEAFRKSSEQGAKEDRQ